MPELSSEYPSREELRSYLNEHWLVFNRMTERLLTEDGVDFRELNAKFYDSVLKSLYRLNDFSRKDKFWFDTNEKPTMYKLSEFCGLKLAEDENDALARWTVIALTIKDGSPWRDCRQIIERLIELNELKTDFLVKIYLNQDMIWGNYSEELLELINAFNLEKQIVPVLKELAELKDEYIKDWAERVLDRIENQ